MAHLRKCIAAALLILAGPGLASAMVQQQAGADLAIAGHLYIQFASADLAVAGAKTGIDAFDRQAEKYSVTAIEKAFPSLDIIVMHRPLLPSAEALRRVYLIQYASPHIPALVAQDLATASGVDYVEPVYRKELYGAVSQDEGARLATPNDPGYSLQTHLPRMQLPSAWDVIKGEDSTAVIAIVDGGTNWQHEDLEANVWTNPNEIAGNGIDDDNNGFVDDLHGWNFNADTADPSGPASSSSAWHGTAVAGAAAAVTDNNTGIAGSSWNALFMAVNASCSDLVLLCHTTRGIVYAGMNGADVVTASFGSPTASITAEMAIQAALDEGTLVVAASGNATVNVDLTPHYPSSFPTTLSVGGIRKTSDSNVFNYGQSVNVFAPGTSIDLTSPSNQYSSGSGTSFSVPLVAGVAALVKTAFPSFSPEEVREQIRLTAVNIDTANPQFTGKMGRGKVDADRAVTAAPVPGIRVVAWSYANQDGNTQINSGDQVQATITFKNFHGAGADIFAELTSDAAYLQWSTQRVGLGSMANGETRDVTFSFSVAANAPDNRKVRLAPRITMGSFEDMPDLLRISVNETGVAVHSTSGLSVSITDEGNIGHTSFQGASNSRGIGFVTTTASGANRDVLFEGGLLIATSPSHVSDCVRQSEQNSDDQQEDFALLDGTALEILSPGERTSEQGRVVLTDSRAASPIGVEVLQESFVDYNAMNEDFILLQYTITNKSASQIDNMHVGLFFDWDVATSASDVTRFDAARGVGYLMDSAANPTMVVGTRLLTPHTLHYSAIDNAATIYRGTTDGFTSLEKWTLLTGGILNNGVISGGPRDVSQITAGGPFSLEPLSTVEVAFALISGTSESDFLANADNAMVLWDAISTATVDDIQPTGGWEIKSPYPHPAVFPLELRFETAAHSGVQLDIYDVLGRRIRTVLDVQRPSGQHVVTWDGRDESGGRVPSGLYLVRMVAQSGSKAYVQSRPIMVVR